MKISNNLKTIFKTFIAVLTVSVVLAACSKDKVEPQQVAGLSVINAFPDTLSLDFIIDQTRANDNPFNFNSKIDYLNLFPGNRLLGVTKKESNKFLATERYSLASGIAYSVFVIDTTTANTKKFLLIEDDLSNPEAQKAKIRFVNLSKDPGTLSLGINGKEPDLFTGKAFYEYTPFTSIDPGESITFEIKDNTTVKATLPNVKIEQGKIYTIYAKGFNDATIDSLKLGAAIYTHK